MLVDFLISLSFTSLTANFLIQYETWLSIIVSYCFYLGRAAEDDFKNPLPPQKNNDNF